MKSESRSFRNVGFTLVELLVVISIIALLLAILMPALQSARQQAFKVVCTANMKQMGLMFSLYLQDNKDYLPPAYVHNPNMKCWYKYIRDARIWEKKVKQLFICKADPSPLSISSTDEFASYKANIYYMGRFLKEKDLQRSNTWRYSNVRRPSSKILIVEGRASYTNPYMAYYSLPNQWPSSESKPELGGIDRRHKGRSNYLWLDWHVSDEKYLGYTSDYSKQVYWQQ